MMNRCRDSLFNEWLDEFSTHTYTHRAPEFIYTMEGCYCCCRCTHESLNHLSLSLSLCSLFFLSLCFSLGYYKSRHRHHPEMKRRKRERENQYSFVVLCVSAVALEEEQPIGPIFSSFFSGWVIPGSFHPSPSRSFLMCSASV